MSNNSPVTETDVIIIGGSRPLPPKVPPYLDNKLNFIEKGGRF